jgi:hypothetical protein
MADAGDLRNAVVLIGQIEERRRFVIASFQSVEELMKLRLEDERR